MQYTLTLALAKLEIPQLAQEGFHCVELFLETPEAL